MAKRKQKSESKKKTSTPKRSLRSSPARRNKSSGVAAAKMLKVDVEVVRRHIAAGAPVGPKGEIDLIHYAAWLIGEIARGDRQTTS